MLEKTDHPKRQLIEIEGRCHYCQQTRWIDRTMTEYREDGTVESTSHERVQGDCSCH